MPFSSSLPPPPLPSSPSFPSSPSSSLSPPPPPSLTPWSQFPPQVQRIGPDGITLLGAPLGTDAFCNHFVASRVLKIRSVLNCLPSLEDPQIELHLLRSCFSFPKLCYSLRTCPSFKLQASLKEFDFLVNEALISIVGQTLSAAEFQQANLPTYKAGIGLRSAEWSADAAFVASVLETADLREAMLGRVLAPPGMALAKAALSERLADSPVDLDTLLSAPPAEQADRSHGLSSPSPGEVPAPSAPPPSSKHIQHTLLQPLDELSFSSLFDSQPIRSRARLQAASRRGASGWLHILPIKALGYRLAPRVVRAALRYRLGVRIFASSASSLCPLCTVKPALLDPWGDHAVICPCTGKRIAKHNRLRDVLYRFAVKGSLSPAKEVRLDSMRTVPGDIYFPMWSRNRGKAFDVMITSPLQPKLGPFGGQEKSYCGPVFTLAIPCCGVSGQSSAKAVFHEQRKSSVS